MKLTVVVTSKRLNQLSQITVAILQNLFVRTSQSVLMQFWHTQYQKAFKN